MLSKWLASGNDDVMMVVVHKLIHNKCLPNNNTKVKVNNNYNGKNSSQKIERTITIPATITIIHNCNMIYYSLQQHEQAPQRINSGKEIFVLR